MTTSTSWIANLSFLFFIFDFFVSSNLAGVVELLLRLDVAAHFKACGLLQYSNAGLMQVLSIDDGKNIRNHPTKKAKIINQNSAYNFRPIIFITIIISDNQHFQCQSRKCRKIIFWFHSTKSNGPAIFLKQLLPNATGIVPDSPLKIHETSNHGSVNLQSPSQVVLVVWQIYRCFLGLPDIDTSVGSSERSTYCGDGFMHSRSKKIRFKHQTP